MNKRGAPSAAQKNAYRNFIIFFRKERRRLENRWLGLAWNIYRRRDTARPIIIPGGADSNFGCRAHSYCIPITWVWNHEMVVVLERSIDSAISTWSCQTDCVKPRNNCELRIVNFEWKTFIVLNATQRNGRRRKKTKYFFHTNLYCFWIIYRLASALPKILKRNRVGCSSLFFRASLL